MCTGVCCVYVPSFWEIYDSLGECGQVMSKIFITGAPRGLKVRVSSFLAGSWGVGLSIVLT